MDKFTNSEKVIIWIIGIVVVIYCIYAAIRGSGGYSNYEDSDAPRDVFDSGLMH